MRWIGRLAMLVAGLVLGAAPARAGELGTVTLIGQLSLPRDGNNTDVWGWIHPLTAVEYAIVGNHDNLGGFAAVDCSDPTNPVLAKQVTNFYGFDVKAYHQYIYCVNGYSGSTGGNIVDLLTVKQPDWAGMMPDAHNIAIDPRGWLYLIGVGSQKETRLYDLRSDPTHPALVWEDNVNGTHDASVVGNRLYSFGGFNFTRVYDITNPQAPTVICQINDPAIVYHHSGYPTEDGNYLVIPDELAQDPTPDITVWDISNLADPKRVAEIADPTSTVHNLYIVGDYAFVSYYTAGFKVFDVSDPTQPRLADEYDTAPSLTGEGKYDGGWGVYPFTNSGAVFVSDKQSGLFVFQFTPPTSAVAISSFVAAYLDGRVRLDWSIASAVELEGFHIYRSRERDGGYVRLNDAMLPEAGVHRFDDFEVEPGQTYYYRMGAIDRDGEVLSPVRAVTIPRRTIRLEQNYPNPFNPSTTIEYEIDEAGDARLAIFDAGGRRIRGLVDGFTMPGVHRVVWDGRDDRGEDVSSGIYFYRLSANGDILNRRLALVR